MRKFILKILFFATVLNMAGVSGIYSQTPLRLLVAKKAVTSIQAWNPAAKNANITLSNNNLTANSTANGTGQNVRALLGASGTQKKYWEILVQGSSVNMGIGFGTSAAALNNWLGSDAFGWEYWGGDGWVYHNNGALSPGPVGTIVIGDYVSFAIDMGAGTCEIRINDVLKYTVTSGISGTTIYPMWGNDDFFAVQCTAIFNGFHYTPPVGYSAF